MNNIVGFMVWKDNVNFCGAIFDDFTEHSIMCALKYIRQDLEHYDNCARPGLKDMLVYKAGDMLRPITKTVWE